MYPGLYDGSCETQRRTGGAFLGGSLPTMTNSPGSNPTRKIVLNA